MSKSNWQLLLIGLIVLTISGAPGAEENVEVNTSTSPPTSTANDSESTLPLELFYYNTPVQVSSLTAPETVFNSVSTVTVIDQEMLKHYHFTTISEAVETVAGFGVWRTLMKGGIATSRGILQEMYANKVLIMINNVPTWNACTGEGELDRVGLNEVDRIEILRGPASVIYGSNAYTGAVNIILKKSTAQAGKVEGGFGNGRGGYNGLVSSFHSSGSYSTTLDGLALFLGASMSNDTGEDFVFWDEGTAAVLPQPYHLSDYYNNRDFTFNASYQGHSLLVNAAGHDELFYGNNMTAATGLGKNHVTEGTLLNYAYDLEWEKLKAKYSLTYDWNRRNFSRSSNDDLHSDLVGIRFVNALDASYLFWDALSLEVGGENDIRVSHHYNNYRVSTNEVVTENGMGQRYLREWSGFGQLGYTWNMFKFLAGSRYTQNQQFGSNISSRGTIVCSLDSHNSIKAIAGQSYRSPSIFETDFISPLPLTVFGNADLKPEKSNSYELVYLASYDLDAWGNLFLQATGYYATYEDGILRARANITYRGVPYTNVNVYRNADKFSARGSELEIKYKLADTQLFINGDYQEGDDSDKIYEASTGAYTYNFKYVPKFTLSGGVSQDLGPFCVSCYANYYDKKQGPFELIPASYTLSAAVEYTAGPLSHSLTLRNVTDQQVSVPEYVRRSRIAGVPRVNAIPLVRGQRLDYTFTVDF